MPETFLEKSVPAVFFSKEEVDEFVVAATKDIREDLIRCLAEKQRLQKQLELYKNPKSSRAPTTEPVGEYEVQTLSGVATQLALAGTVTPTPAKE